MDECKRYFNDVYDATYHDLLRYAVIKTSSAQDAADVVQEVYTRFFARLRRRGFGDIQSAKGYLWGLMKRELASLYRERGGRAARESALEEWEAVEEYEFEPEACARCDAAALWQKVRGMPEGMYKAFTLFYGFDMSVKDISAALSISEQNVKTRLYRARQAARAAMKGDANER